MEMAKQNQEDEKSIQKSLLSEAEEMMIADGFQPQKLNDFQKADYYKRLAIRYIRNDPFHFLQAYVLGIFHTFTNICTSDFARIFGKSMHKVNIKAFSNIFDLVKEFIKKKGITGLLIASLIIPFLVVTYFGLIVGMIVSWKSYNRDALLFCLLVMIYFVAITGAAGIARFKLPSIPFYLAFSGIGISYFRSKIKYRKTTQNRK
jgi:hypothetical protein